MAAGGAASSVRDADSAGANDDGTSAASSSIEMT